jgi:hypothetical protein
MEFMDKTDITQKILNSVTNESAPMNHDFFSPLNELDPMIRPKRLPFNPPRFNFKIFHLAGAGSDPQDQISYIEVMNKVVSGEYTHSTCETYHTKDGDIRVFLQWYEWPAGNNPNKEAVDDPLADTTKKKKKKAPPKDPTADGFILSEPTMTV